MGRYKLLGCKIMEREIASVVYSCKNVIDVTLIRRNFTTDRIICARYCKMKLINWSVMSINILMIQKKMILMQFFWDMDYVRMR